MNRGVFFAALVAAATAAPMAAQAQNPLQQGLGPETAAPPAPPARPADVLPGYAWDPQSGHYVAENGRNVWVPGHWDDWAGRRAWIGAQWLQRRATAGYGR